MSVIQLIKLTITEKLVKLKKIFCSDHDRDKYITTQEFGKLAAENCTVRLAHANLASKIDIANFVKNIDLNKNELN